MIEYDTDPDRAQQLSNAALAMMAELGVAAHPNNYTIFFNYLSGEEPDLKQTINILRSNHREFDELQCRDLFTRFFDTVREREIVSRITDDLRNQLTSVLETVRNAGIDTRAYGEALDHFCEYIGDKDFTNLEQALKTLLGATREIEGVNRILETRLDNTSTEISKLRRDLEDMKREAMTDCLTGIANRKAFDLQLRDCAMQSMETGKPLSLLLIDIDYFKTFNDTHGHQAGDQVIRLMAQTLQQNVKGRDTAARYGGEEFAVILPMTGLGCARQLAEHIRHNVETRTIISRTRHQELGKVTVSIGVSTFEFGEPLARFIERADQALYLAKAKGRNRVATERQITDGNKVIRTLDIPAPEPKKQRCA
ncbi:diguanylate cyclase [Thalassospira xiamenensis]|uniref:GGDEF domain-containing protein n=1 Tax=Thalassospira xiamenensis TaxID=220697 RepID=UPI000DEDEB8B|nr:GGDEF domain-containing protein [Thalassospira xiamenensis]RCK31428.1 diguanylate cyclase [Thalassospira xiamenensis]